MNDDTLIVATQAEVEESARNSLTALGLTYRELEQQAARGDFSSAAAHALWVSIGGTVNL